MDCIRYDFIFLQALIEIFHQYQQIIDFRTY